MKNTKPELLLPAGNVESFHAALEGGANAIYMGLRQFNARCKASNFNLHQYYTAIKEARRNNVKVFLTLNTGVKNTEIAELTDVLNFAQQVKIDAVIIQDWGIYYLIKQFFPDIPVHASTQMGNHNSLGALFSEKRLFERIILARELTFDELSDIKERSKIQLEIFTHGALCYSFSGMCLFSSYLAAHSANRGLCVQPCRRLFTTYKDQRFLFSLKDNQQIELIPDLIKLGIDSLKIEGRMKSAGYVYNVAKAYRMVIDDFTKIEEARELLRYDTGREKTSYFMGKSVADSITTHTNTGILTGKVTQTSKERFYFSSEHPVKENFRLRIHAQKGDVRSALKAKDLKQENHGHYSLPLTDQSIQKGDNVFIASAPFKSFPSKFKKIERLGIKPPHPKLRKKINQAAKEKSNAHTKKRESLWLRIDTLEWLKKISFNYFDHVILNFDKKNWQDFKPESPFIQKNKEKIFIELPKFIAEKDITFYKELLEKLNKQGIHNSSVSHLSQKLLLPGTNRYICNENVYAFNDFSIRQIYTENASTFIYPVEISQEELVSYQNKTGIVPLYFFPELFYSRMPLKELSSFKDEKNKEYTKTVKNGITVVHPTEAVSLIQYKDFLIKKGFYRFLIDLSHARPTNNLAKKLIKRYNQSDQVQPSTIFNFKRGLK